MLNALISTILVFYSKDLFLLENISILKELAKDKVVLLIEDDETIMKTLYQFFSKFFLNVYTDTNVDDAFSTYKKIIEKEIPVLVVTDINLGAKSGTELICLIKKLKPKQKVIAISAHSEKDIFIDSINCGVNRFVSKPIDMDILLKSIVDMIEDIEYGLELKKNKKMLEESRQYSLKLIQEQKQFLKNAIHEINTPLAIIILNIDLLRMQNIDNDSLNSIEAGARIIQSSYEDMTYLIKHGRVEYPKVTINLLDFIESRITYFNYIAKIKNLDISLRVGQPYLRNIKFNEQKIQRMVDNTLSNAIKYSYKSTTILVSVGLQNDKIFFEIKNFGPPIIDKQKILNRYYRESDDKMGLGLGLNIVLEICKEENIKIEINSSEEKGTFFRYVFLQEN